MKKKKFDIFIKICNIFVTSGGNNSTKIMNGKLDIPMAFMNIVIDKLTIGSHAKFTISYSINFK